LRLKTTETTLQKQPNYQKLDSLLRLSQVV